MYFYFTDKTIFFFAGAFAQFGIDDKMERFDN